MSQERISVSTRPDNELNQLPVPDEESQAHSARLINLIRDEITQAGGRITFARYMELVLFAPGLGYYSAGSRKFGEEGDFVTAPEISSLFSRALAQQVAEVLQLIGGGEVLEVGAGSGVMAADMLIELDRLQCLPSKYLILELSADLRDRQQQTLTNRAPHLLERVSWLEALPSSGFKGVVVANELLDAMPVHCFSVEEEGVKERYVIWQEDRFRFQSSEPETSQLKEQMEAVTGALPVGYQSEINLASRLWISSVAEVLDTGVILLLDYGFPAAEYYHPQRNRGTLMCHYRHRAHDNPFVYPGLQDITTHVEFSAIADSAVKAGLSVAGYTSQAYFLLANNITRLAETDVKSEKDQLLNAQQIRTLTMPGEMGELFKVMALSKNLDDPLQGFSMQDSRHKL